MSKPRPSRSYLKTSWQPFWQRVVADAQPHEVQGEVFAEIDRRIERARTEEVHDYTEGAAALDEIRHDPAMRGRLRLILAEFLHSSGFRWPFRQGHLSEITNDLKAVEDKLRELMDDVTFQAEMLMQAAVAFRDVPGIPDSQDLARAHVDAHFGIGFLDGINTVTNLARHARALEGAVLSAHGPDDGNKALADRLQADEREQLLSDLAALWRDTGRDIPMGNPAKREPFVEFVTALHMAMGAGDIPKIEDKVRAMAT